MELAGRTNVKFDRQLNKEISNDYYQTKSEFGCHGSSGAVAKTCTTTFS